MLSDIENLDIMLGENHFSRNERDESVSSNRARRPERSSGDEFENNDENRYLDWQGAMVLVLMPITAETQQEVTRVLRSIYCRASYTQDCQGS